MAAAEALLAQVQHDPQMETDRRQKLLSQAEGHLADLNGQGRYSRLAAALSNQVALGLGKHVAWDKIDEAFEAIVGENYTGTVSRFLNKRYYGESIVNSALSHRASVSWSKGPVSGGQEQLRAQFPVPASAGGFGRTGRSTAAEEVDVDSPETEPSQGTQADIAELLLADFTSVDLLRGFGQLYLARAESLIPGYDFMSDQLKIPTSKAGLITSYAQHAYDCFDACRVLEEATSGESSVVKFLRGRAITVGAAAAQNPDPFSRAAPDLNKSMLEPGNSLLHSAFLASVGQFHRVCHQYMRQSSYLMKKFGLS